MSDERAEGFWWVRLGPGIRSEALGDGPCGTWRSLWAYGESLMTHDPRDGGEFVSMQERVHEWGPYLGKGPTRTQELLSAALQGRVSNEPGWPDSKQPYDPTADYEGEDTRALDGARVVRHMRRAARIAGTCESVHPSMGLRCEKPRGHDDGHSGWVLGGPVIPWPHEGAFASLGIPSELAKADKPAGLGEPPLLSYFPCSKCPNDALLGSQLCGDCKRKAEALVPAEQSGPEGIHAALAYLGRECAAADGRALGVLLDLKAYAALVRHYPDAIAIQPGGIAVMTECGTIVVEPGIPPDLAKADNPAVLDPADSLRRLETWLRNCDGLRPDGDVAQSAIDIMAVAAARLTSRRGPKP